MFRPLSVPLDDDDGDLRTTLSSAGPTFRSPRRRSVGSRRLSWKRASKRPLTLSGVMAHAILLFDGALTQAPRSGLVCQKQASYHRFTRLRSECSYFIVRVWTRFAIDRGTVSSTPFSAKMFVTDGSFRPRKCLTWLAFSQSYIYIFSLQSCTMGFAHLRPISYGKPVLRLKMEVSTPSQACLTYTIRFAHIRVNEAEWGICFKKPSC